MSDGFKVGQAVRMTWAGGTRDGVVSGAERADTLPTGARFVPVMWADGTEDNVDSRVLSALSDTEPTPSADDPIGGEIVASAHLVEGHAVTVDPSTPPAYSHHGATVTAQATGYVLGYVRQVASGWVSRCHEDYEVHGVMAYEELTASHATLDGALFRMVTLAPSGYLGDAFDVEEFVSGYCEAALWADCMPAQPCCAECGELISRDGWSEETGDRWLHDGAIGPVFQSLGRSYDHDAAPDGNYSDESGGRNDLTVRPESRERMASDCRAFIAANRADLDAYAEQLGDWDGQDSVRGTDAHYSGAERAGHDFYLTRHGHGVGYSDRTMEGLSDDVAASLDASASGPFGNVGGFSLTDMGDGTAAL